MLLSHIVAQYWHSELLYRKVLLESLHAAVRESRLDSRPKSRPGKQFEGVCSLTALCLLQIYSGGSVGGAALMNEEKTDICLNWAGNLLHCVGASSCNGSRINEISCKMLRNKQGAADVEVLGVKPPTLPAGGKQDNLSS